MEADLWSKYVSVVAVAIAEIGIMLTMVHILFCSLNIGKLWYLVLDKEGRGRTPCVRVKAYETTNESLTRFAGTIYYLVK